MSSLHDPFDLLPTDKTMDNVVPFLSPAKLNQMVDVALSHKQLSPRKSLLGNLLSHKGVWSGGLATAACIALLISFFSPTQIPTHTGTPSTEFATEDLSEFNELVMLDTWERY